MPSPLLYSLYTQDSAASHNFITITEVCGGPDHYQWRTGPPTLGVRPDNVVQRQQPTAKWGEDQ